MIRKFGFKARLQFDFGRVRFLFTSQNADLNKIQRVLQCHIGLHSAIVVDFDLHMGAYLGTCVGGGTYLNFNLTSI